MRWLYRMQQRIAITRSESNLVLGLVMLAGLGLAARHFQAQPRPLPERTYAEEEIAFAQAVAPPVAETRLADLPVPVAEPAAVSKPVSRSKAAPAPRSINLNTATSAELQSLPRIGPKLAERILAYRDEHGPFERVEELVRVRGIGQKTFAQMEPYLRID